MDNEIDPKVVVKKTTDLLMAAGEVISELRKREEEDGGSYEGGDLLERVQVAQVLILVASGEQSLKSKADTDKYLAEIREQSAKSARERVTEIQKRVAEFPHPHPHPQPQRPRAVATPAPPFPPDAIPGPIPQKPNPLIPGALVMSVWKTGNGFRVKTHVNEVFQDTECPDYFSFSQELVRAMKLLHGEESGEEQ